MGKVFTPFHAFQTATYYSTNSVLVSLVPFYMVIAYVNVITFVALNVVVEKQSKMVETLRIMGMTQLSYWLSWQVTIALIGGVSCAASTAGDTKKISNYPSPTHCSSRPNVPFLLCMQL